MDNNVMQYPAYGSYGQVEAGGVSQSVSGPFGGNVAGPADGLRPTTLQELAQVAAGAVVRFPDFAEGMPFVARVRRPSMLVLAKSGKIPNTLMKSAADLFTGDLNSKDVDRNVLGDVYEVCKIIAEASLIQPSWADLQNVGVELSDDQLMAIFNYSQNGIKALQSFR